MNAIAHPNPVPVLAKIAFLALILTSRAPKAHAQDENILAPPTANDPKMEFVENGRLRLGGDLNLGGAITFLAESSSPETNMINNRDWGRQIQMSFYSGPVPYAPGGKQPNRNYTHIGWNPIQVGDYYGHCSKILECKKDGKALFVKCIPMHWPLDGVPGECTFESWIALDQNTVWTVMVADSAAAPSEETNRKLIRNAALMDSLDSV